MPKVKDAKEAERIVYSYYHFPEPRPYNFKTQKQGDMWAVIFNLMTVRDHEEHEWHIDANTGNINKIR